MAEKKESLCGTLKCDHLTLREWVEKTGLQGKFENTNSKLIFSLDDHENAILIHHCESDDFIAKGPSDFLMKAPPEAVNLVLEQKKGSSFFSFSHTPDMIIPKLYLCGEAEATRLENLISLNITHVLAVGNALDTPHKTRVKYMTVPVWDDPNENLRKYFEKCIEFIEEGRSEKSGGVIIHCAAGISRSSTVTIAYLMHKLGLSFENALEFVLTRHWCHPNEGFRTQLRGWETDLKKKE